MHPALMTEDRRLRYLHPLGSPALTQQGLSSFSPEQADPRTPSVSAACPSPPPNSGLLSCRSVQVHSRHPQPSLLAPPWSISGFKEGRKS